MSIIVVRKTDGSLISGTSLHVSEQAGAGGGEGGVRVIDGYGHSFYIVHDDIAEILTDPGDDPGEYVSRQGPIEVAEKLGPPAPIPASRNT